jgi:hypothetical protein
VFSVGKIPCHIHKKSTNTGVARKEESHGGVLMAITKTAVINLADSIFLLYGNSFYFQW